MQNTPLTVAALVAALGQAVPSPMSCCSSASQHLDHIWMWPTPWSHLNVTNCLHTQEQRDRGARLLDRGLPPSPSDMTACNRHWGLLLSAAEAQSRMAWPLLAVIEEVAIILACQGEEDSCQPDRVACRISKTPDLLCRAPTLQSHCRRQADVTRYLVSLAAVHSGLRGNINGKVSGLCFAMVVPQAVGQFAAECKSAWPSSSTLNTGRQPSASMVAWHVGSFASDLHGWFALPSALCPPSWPCSPVSKVRNAAEQA